MNTPIAPVLPLVSLSPTARGEVDPVFALSELQQALASYRTDPADAVALAGLRSCMRAVAGAILNFPRKQADAPHLHDVFALIRELGKAGIHDLPVTEEDLAYADQAARRDWRGVLAAMLLVPAWQWPGAPVVAELPGWLRSDFVRWLFTAPWNFHRIGDARVYADFYLARLEELMRWLRRSPGAREETQVLGAYASHASLRACAAAGVSLSRHATLRAQLLQRLLGEAQDHYRAPLRPRQGRRLRLGVVHRHFSDSEATNRLRLLLAGLDRRQCEVLLFSYVSDFGEVEESCRREAADFRVLPENLREQLTLLRKAELDVVLFAEDLSGPCNVVTRLALHRVAPLQICAPTRANALGFPEIDVRLVAGGSGKTDESGERILPLADFTAENLSSANARTTPCCRRADFGLPEDATVYVSIARFDRIAPEVRTAWAKLLQENPGSHMLLHPFAENPPAGEVVMQFYRSCEEAVCAAGVDPARLVVSTVAFDSTAALQDLLALGSVRLDPDAPVASTGASRQRSLGELLEGLHDELLAHGRSAFQAHR